MITIAIRSSTTARVSRKTRSMGCTRGAMRPSIVTANAMSVAVGTAQPCTAGVPALKATKMTAGTATPPKAAATGTIAVDMRRSEPPANSRLSSSPTMKKKIASSPSAAQVPSDRSRFHAAGPTRRSRSAV